jgi:hypothetical protein
MLPPGSGYADRIAIQPTSPTESSTPSHNMMVGEPVSVADMPVIAGMTAVPKLQRLESLEGIGAPRR